MLLTIIYLIGLVASVQLYWFVTRQTRKQDRPPAPFAWLITLFWPLTMLVFVFDKLMSKTFGEE